MKTLTVFTLTYNRAYCLHACYESLLRQTSDDFCWLIVDDGSTDHTKELVEQWQQECEKFEIHYFYKENGGMHSGYNVAYEHIDTELAVSIDSDDYMTDDAVEKIVAFWKKYGSDSFAGIVGLDVDTHGKVIGTELPNKKHIKVYDFYNRYHGSGDKKMIYRTELMRPIKAPEYEGERLFPTCYRYFLIDLDFDMLVMNEPLCVVDYAADGFTNNIIKQYKKNLNSFIYYRKFIMTYPNATLMHKYKFSIHYVAECMLKRDKGWFRNSPSKMLTLCALPMGVALYLYIQHKG
jgi:glycosyltransferase involved in cell wall biosynthesis